MGEMKQGGDGDDDARCPPHHPGFVRGLCYRCGAEEEDTAGVGDAPGVAVGYEMMKQGGDYDDAALYFPHPAFICGLGSMRGAKEADTSGGDAHGVTDGYEAMNQGGEDDNDAALCPPHPGFLGGICPRCGEMENAGGSASTFGLPMMNIHGGSVLPASATTNTPRAPDLATLLRMKKLILILDLDHTLLNSTTLDNVSPMEREKGFTPNIWADPLKGLFDTNLSRSGIPILTKLRPFSRGFLSQASAMFEMCVLNTLQDEDYVRSVLKLLDPDQEYFGERILSNQQHMKKLDVILGVEETMLVILDDTTRPGHQDNLILVDSYHYFSSACRKIDCNTNSLAELGLDEKEEGGCLTEVLALLKRVHEGFFDSVQGGCCADVRAVIRKLQSQMPRGCTVAFPLPTTSREPSLEEACSYMAAPAPPPSGSECFNDDIYEEILLRLPPEEPKLLSAFVVVCRGWQRILTDNRFLQRYCTFHRVPPILGYLCNDQFRQYGVHFTGASFTTLPVPQNGPELFAIDSRHGRVLFEDMSRDLEGEEPCLLVWDIVSNTNELVRLPLPFTYDLDLVVFSATVFCDAADCEHLWCHSGPFGIAAVGVDLNGGASAYLYSSGSAAWTGPVSAEIETQNYPQMQPAAIVGKAAFFFTELPKIMQFEFSPGAEKLTTINQPAVTQIPQGGKALMPAPGGGLLFAMCSDIQIQLWEMKIGPNISSEWTPLTSIQLLSLGKFSKHTKLIGFSEIPRSIFVQTGDSAVMVDVDTLRVKFLAMPRNVTIIIPTVGFYIRGIEQ